MQQNKIEELKKRIRNLEGEIKTLMEDDVIASEQIVQLGEENKKLKSLSQSKNEVKK